MRPLYEQKLALYLRECSEKNKPVNLGYVRYLKGRIDREKEAQNNWLTRLLG